MKQPRLPSALASVLDTVVTGRNRHWLNFTTVAAGFTSEIWDFFMFWLLQTVFTGFGRKPNRQAAGSIKERFSFSHYFASRTHAHTLLRALLNYYFPLVLDQLKHCKQCECCFTDPCQSGPTVQILFIDSHFTSGEENSNAPYMGLFYCWCCSCFQKQSQWCLEQIFADHGNSLSPLQSSLFSSG